MKTKDEILEKHCPSMSYLYLDKQGRDYRDRVLSAMQEYADQFKGKCQCDGIVHENGYDVFNDEVKKTPL